MVGRGASIESHTADEARGVAGTWEDCGFDRAPVVAESTWTRSRRENRRALAEPEVLVELPELADRSGEPVAAVERRSQAAAAVVAESTHALVEAVDTS